MENQPRTGWMINCITSFIFTIAILALLGSCVGVFD